MIKGLEHLLYGGAKIAGRAQLGEEKPQGGVSH